MTPGPEYWQLTWARWYNYNNVELINQLFVIILYTIADTINTGMQYPYILCQFVSNNGFSNVYTCTSILVNYTDFTHTHTHTHTHAKTEHVPHPPEALARMEAGVWFHSWWFSSASPHSRGHNRAAPRWWDNVGICSCGSRGQSTRHRGTAAPSHGRERTWMDSG